jgi:hypothetical protein
MTCWMVLVLHGDNFRNISRMSYDLLDGPRLLVLDGDNFQNILRMSYDLLDGPSFTLRQFPKHFENEL